jgi:RNA polymerase sigma-70 factor (ECF subfamily)
MTSVLDAWNDHKGELLRFVQSRVQDPEEARDIVQEAFFRAMRQPNTLDGVGNPRAWLFQAARNLVIDRFRLTREQVPVPEDLAAEIDSDAKPVDALSQCLPKVLSTLSDEDRQAITLCDIEGISQRAFAACAGLTLPAAKARIRRARQRLRSRLVEMCRVHFDESGNVCCFFPRNPLPS